MRKNIGFQTFLLREATIYFIFYNYICFSQIFTKSLNTHKQFLFENVFQVNKELKLKRTTSHSDENQVK